MDIFDHRCHDVQGLCDLFPTTSLFSSKLIEAKAAARKTKAALINMGRAKGHVSIQLECKEEVLGEDEYWSAVGTRNPASSGPVILPIVVHRGNKENARE
jgi:hypothetical protein